MCKLWALLLLVNGFRSEENPVWLQVFMSPEAPTLPAALPSRAPRHSSCRSAISLLHLVLPKLQSPVTRAKVLLNLNIFYVRMMWILSICVSDFIPVVIPVVHIHIFAMTLPREEFTLRLDWTHNKRLKAKDVQFTVIEDAENRQIFTFNIGTNEFLIKRLLSV